MKKYSIPDDNNISVISVDIFDTLLFRDGTPEDVRFNLISKKVLELSKSTKSCINKIYFSRYKSHHWLYDLYNKNLTKEPCINKIYDIQIAMLLDKKINKHILTQAEVSVESRLLKLNTKLADELLKQQQKGKKIILLSDMYLSSAMMHEILHSKDIKFNFLLFMSSEIGVSKQRSDAFTWLATHLQVPTSRIHHIGDNYNSDYINAKKNNIKATFIPRSSLFYYKERILNTFGKILLRKYHNG